MENRITCTDDILNLPDMQSARKLLIQWKIPTKGINKREEAIKLLLEYWKENEGRPVKSGPMVSQFFMIKYQKHVQISTQKESKNFETDKVG